MITVTLIPCGNGKKNQHINSTIVKTILIKNNIVSVVRSILAYCKNTFQFELNYFAVNHITVI